jgi:hypothetical protein
LQAREAAPVLEDLAACVRTGPSGAARFAQELVAVAAGDLRPQPAQMMRFGVAPGRRSKLVHAVQEMLGLTEARAPGERWSGLEGEFAALARVAAAGDSSRRAELLATARLRLSEEVDARAPLRSWLHVFELVANGDAAGQGVIAAERGPRACLDLLALDPGNGLIGRLAKVCEAVADAADARGEPALAAELRARLRLRLEPRQARALVDAWVERARDDPEAYMARFLCCVADDLPPAALDAATIAVQLAPDRQAQVQRVIARLRAAAANASPPSAAAWADLCTTFEQVL